MEQFPFYPLALVLDIGAVNKHCLFFATKNAIFLILLSIRAMDDILIG